MKKIIVISLLLTFGSVLSINAQNNQDSEKLILKTTDSIEILAERYRELNDYKTTYDLYKKAYDKKRIALQENQISIVNSLINLAQASLYIRENNLAREYIDKALQHITNDETRFHSIKPFALFVNAKVHESFNQKKEAEKYYMQYLNLVQKNPRHLKRPLYIDALTQISRFYAFQFIPEKAFKYALVAYDAAKNEPFLNTDDQLRAIRNIANMYFGFSLYKKGLLYSKEGLQLFYSKLNTKKNIKDQVEIEKLVPYLIWINVKSKYYLQSDKDVDFLKGLSAQMDEGIEILDKNKSVLLNPENINILFEHYKLFFSFAKQLHLDLYNLTNDELYLDRIVGMHESILYSKIRKRLNSLNHVEYEDVPENISRREKKLKKVLENLMSDPSSLSSDLVIAEKEWSLFVDSLKNNFPKYHRLKYASIEQSLEDLATNIDSDVTVVRYLYIEKRLYALIVTQSKRSLVALPYINLKLYNQKLRDLQIKAEQLNPILNTLYSKIWKPLESELHTNKVIIIPDGELFNLNFELLTSKRIRTFQQLSTHSLLAKHDISYNFSLLLLEQKGSVLEFEKNLIAYAPEFNEEMKINYQIAISDSSSLDKSYLTLLPQPFSSELVNKFTKRFGGESFLNEKASKQLFSETVREHKIIHIGTHAESNNVSPELSRLVFAKNITDSTNLDDNYLYTYEIYNQDLSSNLAILTACETGKPSYQPGEGMISLAHAFNYAGSESILTSLWQIDEQSSTQILEYFYDYLEDGLPKDQALRKAKLDYLAMAEGRTLHPQYWAGLILMGDTSPIELSSSKNWFWVLTVSLIAIIALFIFYKKSSFFESSQNTP